MTVAVAGILHPFLSACGLVPLLHCTVPDASHSHYSFLPLLVFLDAALSVTALAVLARILAELDLPNSHLLAGSRQDSSCTDSPSPSSPKMTESEGHSKPAFELDMVVHHQTFLGWGWLHGGGGGGRGGYVGLSS